MHRQIDNRRCWGNTGMSIAVTCLFNIWKYNAVVAYWNRTLSMKTKDRRTMTMRKILKLSISLSLWTGLFMMLFSCTKENFTETTDTSPNINGFLAEHEDYSLFAEALRQAGA